MSWASDLPPELLCKPTGLVILTGLDVTFNAIHKSIWDSFCNNRRPDRVPLHFKILGGDQEYPKKGQKHMSYEWYIPKGILKCGWMNKHLNVVPAVVVVFFDLDWDEVLWSEKLMECATLVEIVRGELHGRNTKVAVVLIQRNTPLPPGEDIMAAERAAALCSHCELSSKSLFVLPHNTDHLLGYTIRLENAFYELSQSYYQAESRKVKSHKDFLNKTTHQLLFVRHQFKIAFYNEAKQDTHLALKHYKAAYGHAIDLRFHETNALEIKIIAGFINYKICRLCFQHNVPLDAIAQFRKHIDFFKHKIGISELAFEHNAWLSKQYQIFGDLFDEAIKLGLLATQTQHPGVYYYQAAHYTIARKQLCVGLCHQLPDKSFSSADVIESLSTLEYYGQRPWRQGHQRIEPPDAVKEKEGILRLQNIELSVNHSLLIIPLLSNAVSQYKKYKSPRKKRHIMVEIGEEYYHAKDYSKALTLFKKVMWDYRNEKWWHILTSVLESSLKCAYLTASIHDYITVCLELIGSHSVNSLDEKTRIQMNLIRVVSCDQPEPEHGIQASCVEEAKSLWSKVAFHPDVLNVDMNSIDAFVVCKAMFHAENVSAHEEIQFSVFIRTSCQFPIRFSKLSVSFNNHIYNQSCIVTDGQGILSTSDDSNVADLYLVPGIVKRYIFKFYPAKEDVGSQIQISSISLGLGNESKRCAVLLWPGAGGTASEFIVGKQSLCLSDPYDWASIPTLSIIRIVPRPADINITVDHTPPGLIHEYYPVRIILSNDEISEISDVVVSMELYETSGSGMEQTTHICVDDVEFDGTVISKRSGIHLGTLQQGDKVTKNFFLKFLQIGNRVMSTQVTYLIRIQQGTDIISCQCEKDERFVVNVNAPFEVSSKVTSLKLEDMESVHMGEPFLLLPDISCVSTWEVELGKSELKLEPGIRVQDVFHSQIEGVCLKNSERASECHCLSADRSSSLGSYVIHWRRKTRENLPFVSSSYPLPKVTLEHFPIYVSLELPAYGCVHSPITSVYKIHNKTLHSQEMDVSMDGSDNFLFSGNKLIHFRVLPQSCYTLKYNLYPLVAGHLTLPKININMARYRGMNDIVQKMLPTSLFVKPSGKGDREI